MDTLIEAAHSYTSRGWRVIPLHRVGPDGKTCSCRQGGKCTSKGKHPIQNEWQKLDRLTGPEIQETWDVERAPNLGIATGEESGFWVLDIDPKGGGLESMKALVATHGSMPETWVAETGSGGYHYGFALPDDFVVKNDQAGRVGPGIDVRGQGGQIVAAPSRTDKGAYTVIRDVEPLPAPQWLLDLVRKDEHPELEPITADDLPKPEDLSEAEWKRLSAYAKRIVDLELARLTECREAATANPGDYRGPAWNHTTFEVSCTLIEIANSPWNAYSLGRARQDVLEYAPKDVEFDAYVIAKTFHSARERIGDKARPLPEDRRQHRPADQDPMFSGPDVRNPTEGGGAQANPVAGLPGQLRFFGGEKGTTPLYDEMGKGVMELGPIGWGQDHDFWSYDGGVWTPDHYVVQHRVVDLLGNAYRTTHRANTADVVQRHAQPITADPLEPMMNFRNGMLEWRTGELFDHDPGYGSTVQFGTSWNPEATCPKFDEWLEYVLHEDYVKLAWQMIGYLLLSGNPRQVAFMFYGPGGNGKGTLIEVLEDLIGRRNISNETLDDLSGNKFRAANLFGRIANIAGDIDATYQEHTAMFKRLTGEDSMPAERKNRDSFEFRNWAVPVFSANKFPGSADVTEGYLRRWIIVQFQRTFTAKDMVERGVLNAAFRAELEGIAAKGIAALRDMLNERGELQHFTIEGEALKGKDEFALTIDQVRQWLVDGDVTGGPEVETELKRLYASYTIWADRAGVRKLKESEFSHRLESVGYGITKVAGSVYHKGISVPQIVGATSPSNFF